MKDNIKSKLKLDMLIHNNKKYFNIFMEIIKLHLNIQRKCLYIDGLKKLSKKGTRVYRFESLLPILFFCFDFNQNI